MPDWLVQEPSLSSIHVSSPLKLVQIHQKRRPNPLPSFQRHLQYRLPTDRKLRAALAPQRNRHLSSLSRISIVNFDEIILRVRWGRKERAPERVQMVHGPVIAASTWVPRNGPRWCFAAGRQVAAKIDKLGVVQVGEIEGTNFGRDGFLLVLQAVSTPSTARDLKRRLQYCVYLPKSENVHGRRPCWQGDCGSCRLLDIC